MRKSTITEKRAGIPTAVHLAAGLLLLPQAKSLDILSSGLTHAISSQSKETQALAKAEAGHPASFVKRSTQVTL